MKTLRTIAAGLLLLTGLLHTIQIILVKPFDPAMIITVTFGVIYLVLGFLLFRGNRTILWIAAIVPLVGILLAVIEMLTNPTVLGAVFIMIDIVISVCCFYLLFRQKGE
jgi:uncharacterized membrane protein (DUF2068 family)